MISIAVLLILVAGVVILFDPFYHYHKPLPFLKAVLSEKEYQVPGTLDHFDYDSVIAGSSVAENYNNRWFDEEFNCKSIKAIRSYGAAADLCYFLNRAFDNQELKYVFLNIDPSSVNKNPETTFAETGSPLYLYDKNPFNDIEYLFNKDVLFERIPYMIASSFDSSYDEGESYNWAQWKAFNEETILYHYYRNPQIKEMMAEDTYLDITKENLKLITDVISSHPETEFYIFIPPYSILWWDNMYTEGETLSYIKMEELTMSTLLQYENARLFNFQNATDIVFDLNNYTDSLHFSPEINHYMVTAMKEGKYEIKDASDIETSLNEVASYATTAYDYCSEKYGDRLNVYAY